MKRILVILLLLCMLIPSLVACSGNEGGEVGTDSSDSDTVEALPLPDANPDWVGKEYSILYRENYAYEVVYDDTQAGAVINDAIYHRNTAVENLYGVKFVYHPFKGSFEEGMLNPINNTIMSGDDVYSLASGMQYRLAPNATSGNFLDWYQIPNINLEAEWWDKDYLDAAAYNNHTYIAAGPLSLSYLYSCTAIFMEQDIVNNTVEGGTAEVYAKVADGTWTYEAFFNYVSQCTANLGADTWDTDDQYGFAANHNTAIDAFVFAFDQPFTERTSKGGLKLISANGNEKMINIAELMHELYNTSGYGLNQSDAFDDDVDAHIGMVKKGKAAFTASHLQMASRLRTTDINYGILPYPKWDTDQKNYCSNTIDFCSVFAIPTTVRDQAFVGAITEALAYYSNIYVKDALYNTVLKYRDAQDENSSKSVDIIINNIKHDFAYIYAFAWGDQAGPTHVLRQCIKGKSANISSSYKMGERSFNTKLENFLANFK